MNEIYFSLAVGFASPFVLAGLWLLYEIFRPVKEVSVWHRCTYPRCRVVRNNDCFGGCLYNKWRERPESVVQPVFTPVIEPIGKHVLKLNKVLRALLRKKKK